MISTNSHYLAITLMGREHSEILNALAQLTSITECQINRCQSSSLGEYCVITVLINGTWNGIAKLETNLPNLKNKYGFNYLIERTTLVNHEEPPIPYAVQLIAAENPEIFYEITSFFNEMGIDITHVDSHTFKAWQTDAPLFCLNMTISLPATTHIPDLREKFMLYCDDLNLDAVLEPVKYS